MWIDYTVKNLSFKVGDFVLSFPTSIKFETFNNPDNYYGIDFYEDKYKFEVLDSKLGLRLLINGSVGESKDLPFNKGTAHFLPDVIKTEHINDLNIRNKMNKLDEGAIKSKAQHPEYYARFDQNEECPRCLDATAKAIFYEQYDGLNTTPSNKLNEAVMNAVKDLLYGNADINQRIDILEKATRECCNLLDDAPKNTLKLALEEAERAGWNSGWSTGYDTANARPPAYGKWDY